MMLATLMILLLLHSLKVETAQLECLSQYIRLIEPSDVEVSYVEDGTDDFKAILSLSPIAGNEYFISFDIPNTGNLTFSQTFLLVGFTTQGESISSQDRYVSEFSFQYSDSLDNPYQTYSQTFQVNTINETSFFFEEPLLARRIQLTISDALPGSFNAYYWRMNLFGCLEVNATVVPEVFVNVTTSTLTTSTVITSTMTTSTVITSTMTTSTLTTSILTISTTTTSTLFTTSTINYTVVETLTDQKSESCQKELTAAIVVPVIIILILIVLTVTILIVYLTRIRNSSDLKSTNTIHDLQTKEFPLDPLQTKNQAYNYLERIPSGQMSIPYECPYEDIDEVKHDPTYMKVVEGEGLNQVHDNPADMGNVSQGGDEYQVEDDDTYI